MAQCTLKPDLEFARELTEAGGESLKKCFQCATCSVACPLAPANAPYPRKEMVWASWGLRDKLRADVDLWLCHNCGNCSVIRRMDSPSALALFSHSICVLSVRTLFIVV